MINGSLLSNSCDIEYISKNIELYLYLSGNYNTYSVSTGYSRLHKTKFKFDPGANITCIEYMTLFELGYTEEFILQQSEEHGLSDVISSGYNSIPSILTSLIIPTIQLGQFELKNVIVRTLLPKDKEVLFSVAQVVKQYGLPVTIDSPDEISIQTLMGQDILEHFDYDVRLPDLELDISYSEVSYFKFGKFGRLYLDLKPNSKKLFEDRYLHNSGMDVNNLKILSVQDKARIDSLLSNKNKLNQVKSTRFGI